MKIIIFEFILFLSQLTLKWEETIKVTFIGAKSWLLRLNEVKIFN